MITGRVHRSVLHRLATNLPADAGAFLAVGPEARRAILTLGGPSIVAAIGASGLAVASVPVTRDQRPSGRSAWTPAGRAGQSARTLAWALAARRRAGQLPTGAASHRWTSVSE